MISIDHSAIYLMGQPLSGLEITKKICWMLPIAARVCGRQGYLFQNLMNESSLLQLALFCLERQVTLIIPCWVEWKGYTKTEQLNGRDPKNEAQNHRGIKIKP